MLVQVRARIFEQAAIILARRKIPMHNTIAVLAGGKASMFEFYDTDVGVTYFRCGVAHMGEVGFARSNATTKECTNTRDMHTTMHRQEQFFRYVFGLNEPDCLGIIDFGRKEVRLHWHT